MRQLSLGAVVTIASAASMALEIAAARLIAPYVGMSLYTWTAVIAVVLAGLAVGHWLGGLLSGQARRSLIAVLTAAAATAFLSQFLLRGVASPVLDAMAPVPAVVAVTAIAFLLPSLFAGAVGPLATVLALRAAPESAQGRIVGRMYALGAIGAIAGVLLGGLVLLPFLGAARGVAVIAAAYVVAVALAASGPARMASVAAAALLLGATVAFGAAWSPCARESGYFCIRVDAVSPGVRVLALDHLGHGANDRDDPERLHIPYVALIDALVRERFGAAGPRSAFFIGGGAYTLPRAWAARWPEAKLTVAEIDPQVTRNAREDLWFDGEMRIVHRDARAALVGETGPFDAVIGDAFADISIPPHLVTDEFFAMSAAKLSSDGIYAMNVVDLLRRPRFLTSLAQTLQHSFPVVELWLDEAAISPDEARTTWIVLAARTPTDADRLADGSGRAWVRVPLDGMLRVIPETERMVLTDDHAPVARLLGALLLDRRFAE